MIKLMYIYKKKRRTEVLRFYRVIMYVITISDQQQPASYQLRCQ